MSKETNIQWCDSTVNPTGFQCDGCELWQPKKGVKKCYAGRWAERIGGKGAFDKPIELKPGRMAAAARWSDLRGITRKDKPWIPASMPRLVFIGDMADTFSTGVPFEYLKKEVVDVVRSWPHIGLWLTKRPKVMANFSRWLKTQFNEEWPYNLWPGTSITSDKTLFRAAELLHVECGNAKRFLSIEPLFTPLAGEDFSIFLVSGFDEPPHNDRISWVIVGGESGPAAMTTDTANIWGVLKDCRGHDTPCFVKQLGKGIGRKDSKGGDWTEWPAYLRVRQFPGT